jgi:hypothetical protein
MSVYEQNRAKFTMSRLEPFVGRWVAFSPDGARILASAASLADLDACLVAAGVDPETVALERVEFGGSSLGGAELL